MIFDPPAGTDISDACDQAVALAATHGQAVTMSFNGIDLTAFSSDSPSDVLMRYRDAGESLRRVYEASPEFANEQRKRKAEVASKQFQLDQLILSVPNISSESEWMDWAANVADVADDCEVNFGRHLLSATLTSRGWIKNQHVSDDPDAAARIKGNPTIMAQYIMGQVISCLDNGMPPHPMTRSLVEQYKAVAGQ